MSNAPLARLRAVLAAPSVFLFHATVCQAMVCQTIVCLAIVCLAIAGSVTQLGAAEPEDHPRQWWRGNIHTHSLWSDGDDFPEMIADWYRSNGYHFLALSDHNILSQGQKFMKLSQIESRGGKQVLPKYVARFGTQWVETRGEPGTEEYSIRLKPLDEFRALLEERGKFLMIPGEEISDSSEGGPVHMNATNLQELIEPVGGETVREAITNNLRMAQEQAKKLGREILVHLNHPNFGYAVTAEDLAAVLQERFFEVYNGHPAVGHLGDDEHPSIERMWDIANTLRVGQLNAEPLYGVATDDSHNYHGKPKGASTGRGWVMVRARYLTPEHVIRAMKAGDFYASSGVMLQDVDWNSERQTLSVKVAPAPGETYTIEFIGTLRGYDTESTERKTGEPSGRVTKRYSPEVGRVLAEAVGTQGSYLLSGDEIFVRAVVTSSAAHENPSFAKQRKQAWTQPVVPRR